MKTVARFLMGLALAGAAAGGALADVVLAGNAPFAGATYGQQSDASSAPAYTQAFSASSGQTLDKIVWWGFHSADSMGASFDHFVVRLNGVVQAGTLTESIDASGLFTQYTLDVADVLLTAGNLSIINDSDDVAWFWQSTSATGNPGAPDAVNVSFSLLGYEATATTVPEPMTLPLLALGLALLPLVRWFRAATTRATGGAPRAG